VPFDAEVTHLDLVHFCSVVHLWRFSHTCCASTLLGCCDGGTREEEWSPIYWSRRNRSSDRSISLRCP
jgi:hypothetical protein